MDIAPGHIVLITVMAIVCLMAGFLSAAKLAGDQLRQRTKELQKGYEKQLEKLRGCYLIVLSGYSQSPTKMVVETHLSRFMTRKGAETEAAALAFNFSKTYMHKACSFEVVDLYGDKANRIRALQELNDALVTFAASQMIELIDTGVATDRSTEAWNCLHPHAQDLVSQAEEAIRTEEATWKRDGGGSDGTN